MKSIIYGNSVVNISDSLYITVVSMLTVFLILFVISICLHLFKFIPKEKEAVNSNLKKNDTAKKSVEKTEKEEKLDFENLKNKYDDERIALAIMTACIDASEEIGIENIKINYVKEIK